MIAKEINNKIRHKLVGVIPEYFDYRNSRHGATYFLKNSKVYFTFGYSLREDKSLEIFENNTFGKTWFDIAYPEVEKIIHPILAKNKLFGQSIDYSDVYITFSSTIEIKNQLPKEGKKIENDEDIEYVSDLFIRFYQEDALPYFNHWHSITVLYEYIKTKKDEELWDILGQFAPMKKAIIYRLCNDKLALEIMNNYYEEQKGYYQEDSQDEDNIRYYNTSKELKELLENTEPIYNVEV